MFEFRKLCKMAEQMDPATYSVVVTEKSVKILAGLALLYESGVDAAKIYLSFILTAIAADGKLDESEYSLIRPMLEKAVGKEVSYDDAKAIFVEMGLDKPAGIKNVVDEMVDILGMISAELKADIIIVCLLVCAIDGKVSAKEKKWIKQLIR